MLFVKLVSDEEISFQLGSEISNVQREIKRTIPKITKKRLNKSNVRVLVAVLSDRPNVGNKNNGMSEQGRIFSRNNGSSVGSLYELFFQGGAAGQVIIIILFILSAMTVYIFIERYLTIKRAMLSYLWITV